MLLSIPERRTAAERFREVRAGILIVHCGAQSTADTVALAAHAATIGADGVAVIPPPYYPLGDDALVEHFVAAASACAPTPFYLYAFAARSGYPLPVAVVERVRERVENIAGLKVSDAPFDRVRPFLALGLPVYVGAERLIPEALAAGAAGAVSGLASRLPGGGGRGGAPARSGRRGAARRAPPRDRALSVPGGAQAGAASPGRCAAAGRPRAACAASARRCRGGRSTRGGAAGRGTAALRSGFGWPSVFADRADAGRRLAERLGAYAGRDDVIVLGLPRGGVPVAAEVARCLARTARRLRGAKARCAW